MSFDNVRNLKSTFTIIIYESKYLLEMKNVQFSEVEIFKKKKKEYIIIMNTQCIIMLNDVIHLPK